MKAHQLRNLAFVVMLVATLGAMQTGVLASMGSPLQYFCWVWDQSPYDCDCTLGTGSAPSWGANGNCDFSSIEDEEELLLTAASYMNEAWDNCYEACGDDYREYIADWYLNYGNPFNECYEAQTDPDSWFTWEQLDGNAGPYTWWSCSCQKVFWGECG